MEQDALRELTSLCQQARNSAIELADLDARWKVKKAELLRLIEEDIPTLMAELGVTKILLESGETVEVKKEVEASIPKEDQVARAAAFAWLEDNGHGGLIKTTVEAQFGRDELEQAQEMAKMLADATGKEVLLDRSVHANTLKAFIKEQLAGGLPIPLELFMARAFNRAKIK